MRYFRIGIMFLGIVLMAFGCKSIEKVSRTTSVERDMRETIMNELRTAYFPQYLLAERIDVRVEAEDNYNAKMVIYLDKGKSIFVSIRFIGFEVMRAMLTKDSIKYINRIKQEYYFDDLKKENGFPEIASDLERLQNLIYSGFFYSDEYNKRDFIKEFQIENEHFVFNSKDHESNIKLMYNLLNIKLDKVLIVDQPSRFTALVDIGREGGKALYIKSNLNIKGYEVLMDMGVNKVENKEYKKTDFIIGKNYKRLEKIL